MMENRYSVEFIGEDGTFGVKDHSRGIFFAWFAYPEHAKIWADLANAYQEEGECRR